MEQNYPNPFNPITKINYLVPNNTENKVELIIFDILGKVVEILVNEQKKEGKYSVQFDANKFSSGVYYYQLKVGKYTETKKMVLIK